MKTEDIKQLLEAYYEGEISPSDEQLLLDYFGSDAVAPELADEAYIFMQIYDGEEVPPAIGLDAKLEALIDDLAASEAGEEKPKLQLVASKKKSNILAWFSVAAACAAILISVMFFVNKPQDADLPQMAYQDTYSDPDEAYMEAEKALLLISNKLNKGLSQVTEVNNDITKANNVVNNTLNTLKTK
ncbi:hypothetical protein [Dysgonomonas sp. 25]|uniref:hypothetical protein n=1 Tax=Dysgonomonas sp. 25 TaxID=2302933 RepID=UPI0013D733FD|nr:hypothetical protein [Dysgonomonas sp. 25]NDV67342.1 hypothetical protein [Dysgonomonas sp. 25]